MKALRFNHSLIIIWAEKVGTQWARCLLGFGPQNTKM